MANRPTVGGSDGTWGNELNAYLDVSLDTDGKVDDGAAQTTSAAPGADAELANKKYTDDQVATKEDTLVTQATASIFGSWTNKDSGGSNALAVNEIYAVGSDGFVVCYKVGGGSTTVISVKTDSSNPPTTIRLQRQSSWGVDFTCPVKKDDYWTVVTTDGTTVIFWLPIGTGTCVKQ